MLCATMLAGCGGGGGGSNESAPVAGAAPAATASISGKAIDGYLAGATVCLDLNANNACDDGEPSTTTNATGDFVLPYEGATDGKRLVVQVTPATKDLSRPAGFTFPASYSMSAVLDGGTTGQHVSPLTSLVTAQMEAGMSRAEALRAVQTLLGNAVDPTADFVANGDAASAAKASAIVDTITSLARDGKADAATVRNVLNAMVAKGDVAVTQADVDAQASKPLYALTDASRALAQPLYSFIDLSFASVLSSVSGLASTQMVQQIANGGLQKAVQILRTPGGAWEALDDASPTSLNDPTTVFMMKADGSWSGPLARSQWRAPQPLTSIGRTLAGTDPLTGISFKYESRDVDLSGHAATLAINGGMFGPVNFYTTALLGNVKLPEGSRGYLGIQSYDADRVVLPMGMLYSGCQVPFVYNGGTCPITSLNTYDPATVQNDAALPAPLTSIQQLVGVRLLDTVITSRVIDLNVNGTVTLSLPMLGSQIQPGQPQGASVSPIASVTGTWAPYARNENVLVIDLSRDAAASVAQFGYNAGTLTQGAKLVLAIRNGQLHAGVLFPAGYAERTVQFPTALPAPLTALQMPL